MTPAAAAVTWTSSNPAVATVNANGVVTAVGEGTATITATVAGKTASCAVTVRTVRIGLNQSSAALYTNGTLSLSATVNYNVGTVRWSTSNANVVTVDGNGAVTAVGAGTATITATVGENIIATCQVNVSAPNTPAPSQDPDDDDDDDDDPTPTVTLPDPPVPLAPNPAAPTAPVTPSTPSAPVTPVTPPTASITDPQVPLANAPAAEPNQPLMVPVVEPLMPEMSGEPWSLVNLLLMLFTALASVWQMLRKSRNRRSLFTLIPAIGALLLFFFTENMRNPMALFNQFTVFMVMIAAVQIVLLVFHAKNDEETGDAA